MEHRSTPGCRMEAATIKPDVEPIGGANMSRLETANPERTAIKILRKSGYLVSEKGITHILDDPKEASSTITIYPWRKIKSFERHRSHGNIIMMKTWGGDCGEINVPITLVDQQHVPMVYQFLTDRFLKHGG